MLPALPSLLGSLMPPLGRWSRLAAVLSLLLLTSCARWHALNTGAREPTKAPPVRAKPMSATYDDAEYAPYREIGSGRITGQAFGRSSDGTTYSAAGLGVYLSPVTSYSREWYRRTVLRGDSLSNFDPRARSFITRTVAGTDGDFYFDHLPAGEYYVISWINWDEPDGEGGSSYRKICVGSSVRLSAGADVDVVLEPISLWNGWRRAWYPAVPDTSILAR